MEHFEFTIPGTEHKIKFPLPDCPTRQAILIAHFSNPETLKEMCRYNSIIEPTKLDEYWRTSIAEFEAKSDQLAAIYMSSPVEGVKLLANFLVDSLGSVTQFIRADCLEGWTTANSAAKDLVKDCATQEDLFWLEVELKKLLETHCPTLNFDLN